MSLLGDPLTLAVLALAVILLGLAKGGLSGVGALATVADGASIAAESPAAVVLKAGSAYAGWDVEIYAPGATGVTVDGAAISAGVEGCESCFILDEPWVRVVLPAGEWSVGVE